MIETILAWLGALFLIGIGISVYELRRRKIPFSVIVKALKDAEGDVTGYKPGPKL